MKDPNNDLLVPNMRRQRAGALVSVVMKELADIPEIYNFRRDIACRLCRAFEDLGIDFVTDEMRSNAGLPQRGEFGWTDNELRALEAARWQALIRPLNLPAISVGETNVSPTNGPKKAEQKENEAL